MQCNSCGSKWESNNIVTTCPFCGSNLAKAKDPNNMDISDAIESIISNQGLEVLKNTRLVTAHVMDLVRGHDRDKKLFRILCSNGAMEFAYKIAKSTDSSQKEIITKKQIKVLVDDAFLAENNAVSAINIILRGLGEKEVSITSTLTYSSMESQAVLNNSSLPISTKASKNTTNISTQQTNASNEEKQYVAACKVKYDGFKDKDISKLEHAITLFSLVDTYKDSVDLIALCETEILQIKYNNAIKEKQKVNSYRDVDMIERTINQAIALFESLNGFKDSVQQTSDCRQLRYLKIYEIAIDTKETADKYSDESIYSKALMMFERIKDYKDSAELSMYCSSQLESLHKETIYKKAYYYYEKTDPFSLETAISWFEKILDYKDSKALCEISRTKLVKAKLEKEKQDAQKEQEYNRALALFRRNDSNSIKMAIEILDRIPTWKDSRMLSERYRRALSLQNSKPISVTNQHSTNRPISSQDVLSSRKKQGLCQHCGGAFKGLLSRKCCVCGKPKDY